MLRGAALAIQRRGVKQPLPLLIANEQSVTLNSSSVWRSHIGEVALSDGGVKQYNRTTFLTPLLRNYRSFGLSPIFCTAKHRGERAIPTAVTKLSPPSLPAMPRSITGSCKTTQGEKATFQSSPPVFPKKYRGSARRARGVKKIIQGQKYKKTVLTNYLLSPHTFVENTKIGCNPE